ncbi:hypothetical protein [Streptomyces sp. NPDC005953]|uniref:hypothetical protein n=1 Tax=Streptomyces sp. NPDC005953 TaxID=3156719 RepID=UPI0033D76C3E
MGQASWGAGILVDPPSTVGLHLLTDRCPLAAWAWLWIIAGLIAFAAAFVRIGRDWLGFTAAYLPPLVWAVSYATAAAGGEFSRGGFVAVWYLTWVGFIMWAATVPEYSVPPYPVGPRKGAG